MKLFPRSSFFTLVLCAICLSANVFRSEAQEPQVAKNIGEVTRETQVTKNDPENVTGPVSTAGLTRVGVQTAQPLSLSLNDAIRKALEGNNTIEISRDDVRFQETQLRSLLGIYDPVFSVSPTYTRNHTTGQAGTNDFRVNSNFSQFIPQGGGNYQVFFNNTRTENAFAQAQVAGSLSDSGSSAIYSSGLGFSYTQPLFRNMRTDSKRQQIKIARRRLQ
ncbi:MAG: hypothetical protein ACRD43_04500, partial [Pyrinomonadaceae bacterium]